MLYIFSHFLTSLLIMDWEIIRPSTIVLKWVQNPKDRNFIVYFFQCSGLTTTDGRSLLQHGIKMFLISLTVCAWSVEKIADQLLTHAVDPFRFIFTYKMSQDHLE